MKTITVILATCLAGGITQAQTAQVRIAGTNYPAIFADTELSVTNQQRIATDLTLVFSFAPSFEKARGRETGYGVEEGVFSPNIGVTMFGLSDRSKGFFLVDKDNQRSVRIDKVASDLYLRSFALMEAHSNAVQKAREFVVMLNTTNLPAMSIQELRGLVHAKLWPGKPVSDDDLLEFVTVLQQHRFFDISALNVFLQRVSKVNNAEVLVMGLFMVDKSDPSPKKLRGWTFDFYNGKWGFGRTPLDLNDEEIVE